MAARSCTTCLMTEGSKSDRMKKLQEQEETTLTADLILRPVLPVAVLLMLIIGTIMAQATPDSPTIDPRKVEENVVRVLLDENGNIVNPHRKLAAVADDHQGGFGGFYFNDDKSTVHVYMTDTSKTTAATNAFNAAYNGRHAPATVEIVQGNYTLRQLVDWFYQLDAALIEKDVHPSSGSVLKRDNRIQFGIPDAAGISTAREVMRDLDIPEGAVKLVEKGYPTLRGYGEGLREKWHPLLGGVQHEQETLGQIVRLRTLRWEVPMWRTKARGSFMHL